MKNLLLLFLLFSFIPVEAQYSSRFRIGIEYGSSRMTGEIDKRWDFRHAIGYSSRNDYPGNESVIGEGRIFHAGVKSELSLWKGRFTIASGLRYTNVSERIVPGESTQFYLFHPSGQGIDLFRLQEMNESLGYLSIPLEADFLLLGYLSNWQVYVKGGIQAGMKIDGNTRLDFVSKEMEKYKDEIVAVADAAPEKFFSTVYGGIGLRLLLKNGTRFSIECISSPTFLTENNLSLLDVRTLTGVNFMISTPVKLFPTK